MPEIKLELSDLAIEQINSIFDFHETISQGKGSNFLAVLWDCLDELQKSPERWQYLKTGTDKIRRAITRNPQSILLYSFEGGTVFVYEVYDSRQDWK